MTRKGIGAEKYVQMYEELGSVKGVARHFGVSRSTVQTALKGAGVETDPQKLLGKLGGIKTTKMPVPEKGISYYIVTAAQNNTKVNQGFLDNLEALAEHYDAKIMVCPFTYSPTTSRTDPDDNDWFDPLIQEYLVSERVELAPGLVLCAEITRVLPTASRPLSGFETYTGRASSIFPHAKIAMESVPSMKNEKTKFLYTTGAVTKHNYSRTKAGFKGEHHHAYGALIVAVSKKGWWVRQLNADNQNRVHDLDVVADGGKIYTGSRIVALVSGDVHVATIDPAVLEATWGENGLAARLQPDVQVLHDVFDMESRPWQDELSFHRSFEKFVKTRDSVQNEVTECAEMLNGMILGGAHKTVIVRSNHDLKLEKWLDTADYRKDLVNAEFFLRAQIEKIKAIIDDNQKFKVLEWALEDAGLDRDTYDVQFLGEDESYVLLKNRSGGIECGNHGHLGPNGSKGTARGLAKMARKQIIGDKHSAAIVDGVYVTGTCSGEKVAYTRGPSSWSPTHCIVYPNGKRALVTMWAGSFTEIE